MLGLHFELLGDSLTFQLFLGCGGDLVFGPSLLHVAQADVDLGKVLLHLVHVLGEISSEGLEPLHFCGHGGIVTHGIETVGGGGLLNSKQTRVRDKGRSNSSSLA